MSTIAGIDIGYGNTKIRFQTGNNKPKDLVFRSIAAPSQADYAVTGSPLLGRDTRLVHIDGMAYEVGPDADSLMPPRQIRVLHEDYIRTTQYRALYLGALSYIGQTHIDLLVTGLPVQLFDTDQDALRELLQGEHEVPGLGTVTVKRVQIIAQPVGGLLAHIQETNAEDINECASLLIDPGFFTLDWTGAKGLKYQPILTGSSPAGFSLALKAAAKGIASQIKQPFDNIDLLDERLRHSTLRIGPIEIDRSPINEIIRKTLKPAVVGIQNQLSKGALFNQILVCGGAASYYAPIIQEIWPEHPVHVLSDPIMANVRGFFSMAEQLAARNIREAAA